MQGTLSKSLLWNLQKKDWDIVVKIDAYFRMMQEVLPAMEKQGN